jgi:hypothetical protein
MANAGNREGKTTSLRSRLLALLIQMRGFNKADRREHLVKRILLQKFF